MTSKLNQKNISLSYDENKIINNVDPSNPGVKMKPKNAHPGSPTLSNPQGGGRERLREGVRKGGAEADIIGVTSIEHKAPPE